MRRYLLGLTATAMMAAAVITGLVTTGVFAKERPEPEVIVMQSAAKPNPSVAPEQVAQKTEADPLSERVLGDPDAPVTILEYSSMTCPHCARFHADTLPQIKKEFIDTGKAKLIFRDFPFDAVALRASMLARCSNPDRYFGFLDVLFKSQDKWARAQDPLQALAQTGRLAGVGQQEFEACMGNEALLNKILERRLEGEQKYQINSTPSFIIMSGNQTERIEGAQPFEAFARAINQVGS